MIAGPSCPWKGALVGAMGLLMAVRSRSTFLRCQRAEFPRGGTSKLERAVTDALNLLHMMVPRPFQNMAAGSRDCGLRSNVTLVPGVVGFFTSDEPQAGSRFAPAAIFGGDGNSRRAALLQRFVASEFPAIFYFTYVFWQPSGRPLSINLFASVPIVG